MIKYIIFSKVRNTLQTVSYTHLDVYKRQVVTWWWWWWPCRLIKLLLIMLFLHIIISWTQNKHKQNNVIKGNYYMFCFLCKYFFVILLFKYTYLHMHHWFIWHFLDAYIANNEKLMITYHPGTQSSTCLNMPIFTINIILR